MALILITTHAEGNCTKCGKESNDLRPYGEDSNFICNECGRQNMELTKKMFLKNTSYFDTDTGNIITADKMH